ncbi:polysaccharide deacetylase family protein [Halorussus ruber]|uniref:polysaccharide deacetylase family protein n=1 Tax=Halorussus ruber TaxID=1126238 RepID=UPI001092003C|nr:polysaccharide deacetylase family protein [Halorussus ruber]
MTESINSAKLMETRTAMPLFGDDLVVTVDVEGSRQERDYTSLYLLDDLLAETEIQMTLFVTPGAVSAEPELIERWMRDGHVVGLHIHPERLSGGYSEWLSDYEYDEIAAFLDSALETFGTALDTIPSVFRAGRWEYSLRLLRVLDAYDFKIDSSLRPTEHVSEFPAFGLQEIPLTVCSDAAISSLLRNRDISSLPFTIDAYLSRGVTTAVLYAMTVRALMSTSSYTMIAFHDYDLKDPSTFSSVKRYLSRVASVTTPKTIREL